METNQRKAGRPKAAPRTGPIVLGDDRARTKVTLEITERAADELAAYARWVERCSGMMTSEARFKTVDFALREIFRRDRVWQMQRRTSAESRPAAPSTSATTPPAATARTPSPSLPTPTPRDPRTSA
jgi:hypothetical protein